MKIVCPHCGENFELDRDEAAKLMQRIRDDAFNEELEKRVNSEKRTIENMFAEKLHAEVASARQEESLKSSEKILSMTEEVSRLRGEIQSERAKSELAVVKNENTLREEYSEKISKLNEDHNKETQDLKSELAYYKDLKTKMSTKMVGESLEQHCLIEFNKIRGMLSENVYFDKDNEVSESGSKGDFIFRETDEDGVEILSIMFEMKNEMDTTAKKHKNEDFLKELDKDRNEKGCEYAILVSMLESDNELYNCGIVDMSYRYPKMYVIRPQFFIPLITILRNAAMSSLDAKRELAYVKNRELDVTEFEDKLEAFKDNFRRNYELAHKRFDDAIDEIDKTISHLQKVKESLLMSDKHIRIANDKTEDISVKKLCRGNKTMTEEFAKVKKQKEIFVKESD